MHGCYDMHVLLIIFVECIFGHFFLSIFSYSVWAFDDLLRTALPSQHLSILKAICFQGPRVAPSQTAVCTYDLRDISSSSLTWRKKRPQLMFPNRGVNLFIA